MTITHAFARSLMAPIFISGGVEAVRNPDEKAKVAAPVVARLAASTGLPDDAIRLVRINGVVQVVAGSLLVLGRMPRLSSAALAVSLVPTTLAGHPYWKETDPAKRITQRNQLMKNVAMIGGLLFAATDTGGAPSLAWRASRRARRTHEQAAQLATQATTMLRGGNHRGPSPLAELGERALTIASAFGERASHMGERAVHVAALGAEQVARATDAGADQITNAVHQASSIGQHAAELAIGVTDSVRSGVSHIGERASQLVSK